MTFPGVGWTRGGAFAAETAMTFSYVLAVLYFVSRPALMCWTPVMSLFAVSGLVRLGAAATGTSLNPARSFGPALVSGQWRDQWIYLIAPPLGALVAAAGLPWMFNEGRVLTAKLFFSARYRSIFKHPYASIGTVNRP